MSLKRLFATAALALLLSGCGHSPYSTRYNLDFEYLSGDSIPTQWESPFSGFNGYTAAADHAQAHSGRTSLRLERVDSTQASSTDFWIQLPPAMVAGRELTLSGWIRTSDVESGFADLFIDETGSDITPDDPTRGVRGSMEWTHVSLTRKISEHASGVDIGGMLEGGGQAWFDDLRLSIDSQELADTLIPAPKTRLSRSDKKALRKYIYPLHSLDPTADTSDLTVLRRLVGTSHVVGLGENTHGSGETFRLKHRLVRYLTQNMGFDSFSIEGNMAASHRLNEYAQHGRGKLDTLIRNTFWPYDELANLVKWMRHYNRAESRISFSGFDMQGYESPISVLKQGLKDDVQAMALLTPLEPLFEKAIVYSTEIQRDSASAAHLHAQLNLLSERIEKSAAPEKPWLQQNITLLRQFLGQGNNYRWRDRCMAENLLWIKRQNPASKILIWAHNGHVQKNSGVMGNILNDTLGTDYVNFGFTFYKGSYAGNPPILPAQSAYPGTLEYLLEQLDEPIFILDLKRLRADRSPALKWLGEIKFRHLGVIRFSNEFWDRGVADKFDYLIFFRESTPAKFFFAE